MNIITYYYDVPLGESTILHRYKYRYRNDLHSKRLSKKLRINRVVDYNNLLIKTIVHKKHGITGFQAIKL